MHLYKIKKNIPYKLILTVILFTVAIIVLAVCAVNIKSTTQNEQQKHVEDAVNRAVISCYCSEGKYPKNIEYLENHYGLSISENKYRVIYESFADNVRPRINILEKGK